MQVVPVDTTYGPRHHGPKAGARTLVRRVTRCGAKDANGLGFTMSLRPGYFQTWRAPFREPSAKP
jgi:hypothetical protein